MLSLTAEIEIQELDAKDLVTADIYDEKGNIVGQKSNADYEQELKEAEGRVFFGLMVTVGEQAIRIRSEMSSPPGTLPTSARDERAYILSQGFAQIGTSIYKNFSE